MNVMLSNKRSNLSQMTEAERNQYWESYKALMSHTPNDPIELGKIDDSEVEK
jgi:hypothetical protein